jgi:uncharacterized protein YbaR (Trm112 family)
MPLNPDLLEILVCPQCKGSIEASPDQAWLICRKCRLQYEVRDGIPVMLVDEARPLEE